MADVRLIDANALYDTICKYSKLKNRSWPTWIENLINAAPTIDTAPVVRCVECKHRTRTKHKLGFSWCGRFGNIMRDNDFCSWGEKMDGKEG